jgi:putative transposase
MDMKPIRFTEERIIGILRENEAGAKTADLCRNHGISGAAFYKWKAKWPPSIGRQAVESDRR